MKKNKLLITALSLASMVSCAWGVTAVKANAATSAPSFEINTGASIRVVAPAGIRFETKILKTDYASMAEKNAEYGTLVIPEVALGSNELTVSVDVEGNLIAGENVLIIKADSIKTVTEDDVKTEEDETLYNYYNAVLVGEKNGNEFTGLPEEFFGMNFVARSYVVYDGQNGKVVEYATNTSTRSIATVAKYAILDDLTEYDDTEYAYFHDITDYVAKESALSKVKVNRVEALTCEVALEGDEVKAVYMLDTDEAIASNSWAYADGKLTFAEEYLETLENGEYTYKLLTENGVYALTLQIVEEYAQTPAIEDGYDFETNAKLSDMVYDGVVNGNANHQGVISRVKYADEGVSAPENGNKYGVKITSSKQYLVFRLSFGKALSAGDVVSFKAYFVQPKGVTDAIPFKASSELNNVRKDCARSYTLLTGGSTSFGYGKWFIVNFTLVQVNSEDPTSMWCNLTYPSGASYTGLTMYIDDVNVTPAIEDGYNFETNTRVSSMVYDGVVNGNANHQGVISKVKYADEDVVAPTSGNANGVKITSSKQYLVFRINFGKALSAGDVVSFKVYFVQPKDVTAAIPFNASSELNNTRVGIPFNTGRSYTSLTGGSTSFGYGKWFIVNFTLVQVNSADPTSMWCNLTYPSGASYTGLTMYIDDVTVTKAN